MGLNPEHMPPETAAALEHATNEYVAAQELNADRPEAHLNLGSLWERMGRRRDCEMEFKTALSLDPSFAAAAVNLADLYREENRDSDGEQVLRDAITRTDDAALEHALGLLMVRQKRLREALVPLAAAARMAPDNARYSYVYAIALNETGQTSAAIDTLKRIVRERPYDRESLQALVSFLREGGKEAEAASYANRLGQLDQVRSPGSP